MKVTQKDPVYIYLEDLDDYDYERLKEVLSYKDLSAQYEYTQAKRNKWAYQYNHNWPAHVENLKKKIHKSAFFEEKDGVKTYAGLLGFLRNNDFQFTYENQVDYPPYKAIPYAINYTPVKLWSHQEALVTELLKHKHAAAQAPTGSGKSVMIQELLYRTGLSAVIVVPSKSIAGQFLKQLTEAFGKSKVGFYGSGKKDYKKHIVVAIGASLTKLDENSEIRYSLNQKQLLLTDETHLVGAPTVSAIATQILDKIPYRYSVSATPERADGQDTLLTGIIGDVVYSVDFKELVQKQVLAELTFNIYEMTSQASYYGQNAKKNSQEHLLYNAQVIQMAATIANLKVTEFKQPTVILIEEKEQLDYLRPYLKIPFEFAHSGSDVSKQVEDFNAGKTLLLIGTSAVATGTDLKVVENLILLISGKSTIKYKQAIGRATRTTSTKKTANIFDFHIVNDQQSSRHFEQRLQIYHELSDKIVFRDYTNNE